MTHLKRLGDKAKMKRAITCFVIVVLCATGNFAQSRRKRSAGVRMTPGHYFTIGMCRACLYGEWHSDAIRLFRAKGIRAVMGKGYESKTASQPFASIGRFEMRFGSDVGSDSELLVQVELYVGPFVSEEAAMKALDTFPSVLAFIQQKRNRMDGESEGWPISESERVRRTSGNNYEYGFYFIRGYKLSR